MALTAGTAGAATVGLVRLDVAGLPGLSVGADLDGAAGATDGGGWFGVGPVAAGAALPAAGGVPFSGKPALGDVADVGGGGAAIKSINSGS